VNWPREEIDKKEETQSLCKAFFPKKKTKEALSHSFFLLLENKHAFICIRGKSQSKQTCPFHKERQLG
jgi:hypothetical protein